MDNSNNPLHGIKLKQILDELVEYYGWEELGKRDELIVYDLS